MTVAGDLATPNLVAQDIRGLLERVAFVDEVFFSRWSYNSQVSDYRARDAFYGEQSRLVREFCAERGIECETHDRWPGAVTAPRLGRRKRTAMASAATTEPSAPAP